MTIGPPIPEIQFDLEISRSKIKVKSTPVSATSSRLISVVFYIRDFHRLPSLSFRENPASHSRDTFNLENLRSRVKVIGIPVSATHFLSVSHHGFPSTIVPWKSGLSFPRYNLTLKIEGQNWILSFCFTSIWPTIPKIWQRECSIGKKRIRNFTKNRIVKKKFLKFLQNLIIS